MKTSPRTWACRWRRRARTREDRAVEKVRFALTAASVDEAMTLSVVDEATAAGFSPWTDAAPLKSLLPVLRGADRLRTSLVPSLLAARRSNEALGNEPIELFEIARVYLPRVDQLPDEARMIGLTSGRDYIAVKGIVEAVATALNPAFALQAEAAELAILDPQAACRLLFDGQMIGYVGRLTPEGLSRFDLRGADDRGRGAAGPAGRGGRSCAGPRAAFALSGGDAGREPGGRRGGPLGGGGRHRAAPCRGGPRRVSNIATRIATRRGLAPAERACCSPSPCARRKGP